MDSVILVGSIALCVLAGAICMASLVLFVQVLAATIPEKSRAELMRERPRVAVLIPAHDEESGIQSTIQSVNAQLVPGDRLIVVADNCTDKTGEVAKQMGAEVVVRTDRSLVGKGYALDAGIKFLAATGAARVVVFLDADCILAERSLEYLAIACDERRRPIQALYLMRAAAANDLNRRIGEFAWLIKNDLRPTGYSRLGLPCQLMGTGMAIPWELISLADLATGHITEDLLFGVKLTLSGHPPRFCRPAAVFSDFPETEVGRETQRTRWIHGQLSMMRHIPTLVGMGIYRRDVAMLAIAADLLVPPLSMLGFASLLAVVTSLGWAMAVGGSAPLRVSATGVLLNVASLLLAWQLRGRDLISIRDVLLAPRYLPLITRILARFITGRRSGWTRSERKR